MRIPLVHCLESEIGSVEDIRPSVQHTTLGIQNRLVEVQPVQVERHSRNTKGSKPDAHDRPGSQEEVQAAAVVETGVLEDQATEVTVGSHDVVGLFFLAELVAIVLALALGGLADQG